MKQRTFAVFGNPINHSYSPQIHRLFAQQYKYSLNYEKKLAQLNTFEQELNDFFHQGGDGANITTPFKERAYQFCHKLTERARLAGAVNTIKVLSDHQYLGDNTDGIGLLSDLQRLNMITPHDNILIIGAGGAARGVIYPFLMDHCKITITNRTMQRAENLVNMFHEHGTIEACNSDELVNKSFDLIINATTCGLNGTQFSLPEGIIHSNTACYDMFYQKEPTPFLVWAKQLGVERCADGLGMLIAQAAHAFFLWNGVMPDIKPVLQQIEKYMGKVPS